MGYTKKKVETPRRSYWLMPGREKAAEGWISQTEFWINNMSTTSMNSNSLTNGTSHLYL